MHEAWFYTSIRAYWVRLYHSHKMYFTHLEVGFCNGRESEDSNVDHSLGMFFFLRKERFDTVDSCTWLSNNFGKCLDVDLCGIENVGIADKLFEPIIDLDDIEIKMRSKRQRTRKTHLSRDDRIRASVESECMGANIVEVISSRDGRFVELFNYWILQRLRHNFFPGPLCGRYLRKSMHQSRDHDFHVVVHCLDGSAGNFPKRWSQACMEVVGLVGLGAQNLWKYISRE